MGETLDNKLCCTCCGIGRQGIRLHKVNIQLGWSVPDEIFFLLKGDFCDECIEGFWPFELKREHRVELVPPLPQAQQRK